MNLDEIYEDKKIDKQAKGSLLKLIYTMQLFGSIFELYTVSALATGHKILSTIEKNNKKNKI